MDLRRHLEDQGRIYPIKPAAAQQQPNSPSTSNMTTTTTTTTTTSSTNMVVVGMLVGLICILTCVLVLLLVRPVMDFVRSRLPENRRRKELRYRTVEGWVISKVRRHDDTFTKSCTIASFRLLSDSVKMALIWLKWILTLDDSTTYFHTQRLRGHDELCSHALGFASEPSKDKVDQQEGGGGGSEVITNTLSYDTTETAEQSIDIEWTECPICMEDFKAGEIVSWSPDDTTPCQHFFHHECIKGEWLKELHLS